MQPHAVGRDGPTGFRLPPVVDDRDAEDFLGPVERVGITAFAGQEQIPQAADIVLLREAAFRILLSDLEETANLHFFGRVMTRSDLLVHLEGRLRVVDWLKRHPEVEEEVSNVIEKAAQDGGETVKRIQDFTRVRTERLRIRRSSDWR